MNRRSFFKSAATVVAGIGFGRLVKIDFRIRSSKEESQRRREGDGRKSKGPTQSLRRHRQKFLGASRQTGSSSELLQCRDEPEIVWCQTPTRPVLWQLHIFD